MPDNITLHSPRANIQCPLNIECDDKGSNYLHVKYNDVDRRIHVFVSKNIFTYIKYLIRKYFMKDSWTEVELDKSQGLLTKKISILLDWKELEKHQELKQCLMPIFPWLFPDSPQPQFPNIEEIVKVQSPLTKDSIETTQTKKEKESLVHESPAKEKVESRVDYEKIKKEYLAQFHVLHQKWNLKYSDPLTDKCHQGIVFNILEILANVNKMPKEFDTIKSEIKKNLILERMNYFLDIFNKDQTANRLNIETPGPYRKCIVNIYKQIASLSYLNPQLQASEEDLHFVDQIFLEKWPYISRH